MAKPSSRELHTLRNRISEADLILSTTTLPEGRAPRCRELLGAALALTDDFISQAKLSRAAVMGRKGGSTTALRGSDYFRKLAAQRKTRAGGRPKNQE
jgi:hypothetical protein